MQEHMEMGAECMSDVVLLLGQMKQMSLPDLLDHRISKYQREQRPPSCFLRIDFSSPLF